MLVAIPFIPQVTDYDNLVAEIKKRGSLSNHSLLVLTEYENEGQAYVFASKLSEHFGEWKTQVLPETKRRSVKLSNDMFQAAVRASQSLPGSAENLAPAMMYFDPGYRPQRNGWLDEIQSDYYLKQAPQVFGASTPAGDGAKRFNGPLVLSKTYGAESGLLDFLPDTVHWRVHLSWEFTNNSVETKLIGPGMNSVLKLPPQKKL